MEQTLPRSSHPIRQPRTVHNNNGSVAANVRGVKAGNDGGGVFARAKENGRRIVADGRARESEETVVVVQDKENKANGKKARFF